jgi:enoyl-[acyl-carrier protein] reductase I
MPQVLAGKRALITGIVNQWSIAYYIADAFRREGAEIILTYLNDRLKQTVEDIGAKLGASMILPLDVTKQEDLDNLTLKLGENGGKLDAVIHAIAFANKDDLSRPFLETSRDGYLLAQDISAYSLVSLARACAPLMADGGAITTLTYLGSVRVVENYNVMGVAKAALESCVRYLAFDLGGKKIRVNAISAGPIKTAAARGIKDFSKILGSFASMAPLKRNTDPAEVADTAVFLSSDLGRGITGNVVYVDAGFQAMALTMTE